MSRTKLLLDVVEDIHSLADSLQALANAIARGCRIGSEDPCYGHA